MGIMDNQDFFSLQNSRSDSLSGHFSPVGETLDSNSDNNMDIIHLFGKEKLEKIQESLSKATGLAFITVNFRGEPITEATSFSEFCTQMRLDPMCREHCCASDAFGSIQAAVTRKTNVYFCPYGLLEVAIPIIVRGHYLGGFIGGQIRCENAPETVSRLSLMMDTRDCQKVLEQHKGLMEGISQYSYEKFLDIANLVLLVINQLSENEMAQQEQKIALNNRIKKFQAMSQCFMRENIQKSKELELEQINFNPFEMIDLLGTLLNTSIIEKAANTYELLNVFMDFVKYKCIQKDAFVPVEGEIRQAERYLLFQQKKLGDCFQFSIDIPQEMYGEQMPSNILMPFIKNAVDHGVMLAPQGGEVRITGLMHTNRLTLEITDTGPGLSKAEIDAKYDIYQNMCESYFINLGIDYAKDKMKELYGDGYGVLMESNEKCGGKVVLSWPQYHEERTS